MYHMWNPRNNDGARILRDFKVRDYSITLNEANQNQRGRLIAQQRD